MALPQYNHSQGDSQGYSKIWLQGLRSPKRRSTFNAAFSLVHAFVFSCLDYCNSIFAGLLGVRMEKLRRVHRAAVRLIGGFNICRMHCTGFHSHTGILSFVWRCLSDWVPHYLHELCHPLISSCAGRCTLRSSLHGNLVVPFARYATMQTRSFSVVGPATWTGLPIDLRHLPNLPVLNSRTFSRLFFSAWPESGAPLSRYLEGALYKF